MTALGEKKRRILLKNGNPKTDDSEKKERGVATTVQPLEKKVARVLGPGET